MYGRHPVACCCCCCRFKYTLHRNDRDQRKIFYFQCDGDVFFYFSSSVQFPPCVMKTTRTTCARVLVWAGSIERWAAVRAQTLLLWYFRRKKATKMLAMWEKLDENIVRIPKYGCSEQAIMLVFLKKKFRAPEAERSADRRAERPRRRPPQTVILFTLKWKSINIGCRFSRESFAVVLSLGLLSERLVNIRLHSIGLNSSDF